MKQFEGIWYNPETNSNIELVSQIYPNYLLKYCLDGFDYKEEVEIVIESEASAKLKHSTRFNNGIEGSEAQIYIINERSLIIGGEPFSKYM